MSPERTTAHRRYVRAVEKAWSEVRGRAVVLSPREWALASDWASRGIPLACILEVARTAKHWGREPTSLARLAPAVEEAWRTVREGRSGISPEPIGRAAAIEDPIESWRVALGATPPGSALGVLLGQAIDVAVVERNPSAADRLLDERLEGAVPPAMAEEARAAADAALAPYRERMSPDALADTRRRSVTDRLRAGLCLDRLPGASGATTDEP